MERRAVIEFDNLCVLGDHRAVVRVPEPSAPHRPLVFFATDGLRMGFGGFCP